MRSLLLAFLLNTPLISGEILVITSLGIYEGSPLVSRLGKTIYGFRGIRYAKAERFKPPVPVQPHKGVYNATQDGPVCPQPTSDPISEDCLLLNVYTRSINVKTNLKPVIIYLHAGGYYSGSGRSDLEGPDYLLDQDIVLVTINYRLATLGFLSLGTPEAPGNNGLKDQVMALKWIKANIESFGGNPELVTLTGYSAGAASVSCHLVSPMSTGLFHRAIMGSGSSLGNWPVPKNQIDLARKQAKIFGCKNHQRPRDILDCFRNRTAKDFADSLPNFWDFNHDPIILWSPVIEEDFGQERFLVEHPAKSVLQGKFQKMPILTGITTKEFGYKAINVIESPELTEKLNKQWDVYAPMIGVYEQNTNFSKSVSKGLKKGYFDNRPVSKTTQKQLEQLYADSVIGFGVNRAAELFSAKNTHPVYYYEFTFPGRYSHYDLLGTNGTPWGVVHHDELIYLFYISILFPRFNKTDPETKMVEKWTSVWANFAGTGKPFHDSSRDLWTPFDNKTKQYLDAGEKFIMKKGLYDSWYEIWRQLFTFDYYFK